MIDSISSSLGLVALAVFAVAPAQARFEVLSTVIYTNHGDRIPLSSNEYPRLTSLGAQQLYNAGTNMRKRYIAPEPNSTDRDSPTWGLPPMLLDGEYLSIRTTRDPFNVASAQAFMQGLYPPLTSNGNPSNIDNSMLLANNSVLTGPFNGMQFPIVWTAGDQYVDSMYLKGATNCPMHTQRLLSFLNSTEYKTLDEGSRSLYQKLDRQFFSQIPGPELDLSFGSAWLIYDYLNYLHTHNQTVAEELDPADLVKARTYAADWVLAVYANTAESGEVGTSLMDAIAGRTLASLVTQLFADSVLSDGSLNKVNLLFGDQIGMISFAALAGLMVPQHAQFYNLPAPGSSYIFELFANVPDNSTNYPSSANMFVHFLYVNGTDEYASTVEYPLFGASPSQAVMKLSDFISSMNNIMIQNRTQWCNTCQSSALFCVADSALNSENKTSHHALSPAVAGVIGALVALVFALLVLGLAMLLGGVRLYQVKTKRRSELGGFKGAEKLASDQDLTLPKNGASVVVADAATEETRGHERVGSWELRHQTQNKDLGSLSHDPTVGGIVLRRSSFEDDEIQVNPFSVPVRPRDSV